MLACRIWGCPPRWSTAIRPEGVVDSAVVGAIANLPREDFVPIAARAQAYGDRPVRLGNGRALAPPATIGRLLSELEPRPGERALVVGAGSGYSAALLHSIGLRVTALESDPTLASMARAAARGVDVVEGKLAAGHPGGAHYDLILIEAPCSIFRRHFCAAYRRWAYGAVLDDRGVSRWWSGRNVSGAGGLRTVADADSAPLPGFEKPKAFTFDGDLPCDA